MTAEENRNNRRTEEERQKNMLNLAEAWKKMYFESEATLSRAIDEYVASDSFTEFLEQMGKQYLAVYKATSQNTDRFFENHPMPTKKDIARVCELVVDVEEKVDQLESDLNGSMSMLASSLIKLVDFQAVLKDELLAVRREVQAMQPQLQQMQETLAGLAIQGGKAVAGQTADAQPPSRPGGQAAAKVPLQPIQGASESAPAAAPPRPRSRKKPTQTEK